MNNRLTKLIQSNNLPKLLKYLEKRSDLESRFWSLVRFPSTGEGMKLSECWFWVGHKDKNGYGHFSLHGKTVKAHRLAFEFFNPVFDKRKCICHSCDNPSCVNPTHLWLGTQKENVRDMINKGRYKQPKTHGHRNGMSKLKRREVELIKFFLRQGVSLKLLAKTYNISLSTIYDIRDGRTWRHVK